jgi:hypothetical protein
MQPHHYDFAPVYLTVEGQHAGSSPTRSVTEEFLHAEGSFGDFLLAIPRWRNTNIISLAAAF